MAKETKKPGVPPAKTTAPAIDWGVEQVTGMENVSTEDLGIPFLLILQKGSPEVDKSHKDYKSKKIDGAEVGDIINTVTRKVLHKCEGDPVSFVPCTYQTSFVEWRPRDEGGGFVKYHPDASILMSCTKNEKGQDVHENGNLVVKTAYFFGYTFDENGEPEPCVVGMKSTGLKKARQWLNMISGLKVESPTRGRITPPMFSHRYSLSSVPETNESGSWFNWAIESGAPITEAKLVEFGRNSAKTMSLGGKPSHQITSGEKDVPI